MPKITRAIRLLLISLLLFSMNDSALGYSVLTHQAIIDSTWEGAIKPILTKRFPGSSAEQLLEAHAYAYGGAIIQDMGYYPLGSKLFTDLTHYVRSGDFLEALLAESQDLNEYAFALGALAHYAADNNGHAIGVNRAVPLLYPKLRQRYGSKVTYVEDPNAHIKTEFGFDVVQLAKARYAPESYRDFIGFKVSKPVLERAFKKTYGIEVTDLFTNFDLAVGTYRRSVSSIIPRLTKVAWETKKDEIEKTSPGITREKFIYNISREEYDKQWGKEYDKPGLFDKTLALFLRIVPKVGPFAALAFKVPTPEAERMFVESYNATLSTYRGVLAQARAGSLDLQNKDFDTGEPTRAGEYELADEAYAKLLIKLGDRQFDSVTPELRQNILAFYGDLNQPIATKQDKAEWRKTLSVLEKLKATPTNATKARR
ncbi:MAG TPA: zinc dependent phospholipase C family protein [Blastocatellia bacterium]|nr:zinc dependent phospholipase C family protein [Blastocatellia bacterium]